MPKFNPERLSEVRTFLHQYRQCEKKQRARQYWRDAIYQVLQDKRHLRHKFQRFTCLLLERHRRQQARQVQDQIRRQQDERRCVVCLSYPTPYELHLQQILHQNIDQLDSKFPRRTLYGTIRMSCCKQFVHVACVLQSMYLLYGRHNKEQWRCPHCRYLLIESRDDDVLILGHSPPIDSDDEEEFEHTHTIGTLNPHHKRSDTVIFTDRDDIH